MRSPVAPSTSISLAPGRASSSALPSPGHAAAPGNASASLPESDSFPRAEAPRESSCLLPSGDVTSPPAVAGTSSTSKGRMQPEVEGELELELDESWAVTNGEREEARASSSVAALSSKNEAAEERRPAMERRELLDVERAIFPGLKPATTFQFQGKREAKPKRLARRRGLVDN